MNDAIKCIDKKFEEFEADTRFFISNQVVKGLTLKMA